MKLNDILCKECKEKVRVAGTLQKKAYRLRIKQGKQESGKVHIRRKVDLVYAREAQRLYRENNPEKTKARKIVFTNIRSGKLTKGNCLVCGSTKTEAHHKDYSKPLDVEWLCKEHHIEADTDLRDNKNVV